MKNLSMEYRLSTYIEVAELSKEKIYIVKSSIDDKIYIKKILSPKNKIIYEKIKELSIENIPRIYEILDLEDDLIVIEEYINGSSLKEILEKEETISPNQVIEYSLDLIDILNKIHSLNPPIIHKDINPSNIMISNDGVLKLIDFDISRIHCNNKNRDTHILGTHGYAAPEQFGFNQTDPRTDIYSLGVTMNIMLVGKLPNEEKHEGKLSKIISKCIEIDPNKRYQDVNKLKDELLKLNRKNNILDIINLYGRLPGLKSNNILIKILAFLWYFLLVMIVLGVFSDNSSLEDRILDIVMPLFLFALTLLYGNYNDIKSKLPILNSKNFLIRIFGYILYTFILLLVVGIITPI